MLQYQNRIGTHSKRWDDPRMKDGMLSLWVADMDFQCPPSVLEAISKFNDYGIYGYYSPNDSYYETFQTWEQKRHQVDIKREWIHFAPGVVPGINWVLDEFTQEGIPSCFLLLCICHFLKRFMKISEHWLRTNWKLLTAAMK